jgi:cytochrome c oxidase subunit I+III
MGWDVWNLMSTVGAFVLAAGVVVVMIDLLLHLRPAGKVNTNPWKAGTLEWLPMDNYATRSIPRVESRYPLWDNPRLREEVDAGAHYLPGLATGGRETIVTSADRAQPQYLLRLPGPSWLPLLAGVGTAVFFFALTVKWTWLALGGAATAFVSILVWLWDSDPAPTGRRYPVGDGVELPDYMTGHRSHAWWAMVVLMLVDGSVFASLAFSFFYLWTVSPVWPPQGDLLADDVLSVASVAAYLFSIGAINLASRALRLGRNAAFYGGTIGGLVLFGAGFAAQAAAVADIGPTHDGYGASIYALLAWQGLHVALVAIMAAFTLARMACGRLDAGRRVTFDNTWLMWLYTALQGIAALAVIHAARLGGS